MKLFSNILIFTKLLRTLIVIFIPCSVFSQQYNFTEYSNDNGLSQGQVFDMIQDRRGYLWIGTEGGGLNMFDGTTFTIFNTDNGLCSNVIRSVFEDRQGYIWIGTKDNYINQFDGKVFIHYTEKHGLKSRYISSIVQDMQGLIWVSSNDGSLYSFSNKTFHKVKYSKDTTGLSVKKLFISSSGQLFIATEKHGLFIKKDNSFIRLTTSNGLADNNVNAFTEDKVKNIWIATENGISRYDGKRFYNFTTEHGICTNQIKDILYDNSGNLWMGSYGNGVCKLSGNQFIHFNTGNGLCSNYITLLLQDQSGNIWFGSEISALCKFNGERFKHLRSEDGLPHKLVMSVFQDKDGYIWLGTKGGGACRYDGKTFIQYSKANGLCSNLIYCIFQDQAGNIWFGSREEGLSRYDGKQFKTFTIKDGLASNSIYSITEDRYGNLWFISHNNGISIYNGTSFTNISTEEGLSSNQLWAVFQDKEGNMWIATDDAGVDMISARFSSPKIINNKTILRNRIKNISIRDGLTYNLVFSIIQDKKGDMWFGTFGGGICRYDGKKITPYTVKDGLNSNQIYLLLCDSKNNIWCGTEKGINKIRFLKGLNKPQIYSYGKPEGFVGVETNLNAVIEDKKGMIWFGNINGVTTYNPRADFQNETPPQLEMLNIKLFFEDVDWSIYSDSLTLWGRLPVNLELPYNQNHLTFKFSGVELMVPEKIKYKWILEGFDKKWSPETSKNEITYSNIPAGTYTFKVIACNSDGIWNKNPVSFQFRILPPFWMKWWFFLSGTALFFTLILFIMKWREKTLEKEKQMLEEKVEERTMELKREKERVEIQNEEIVAQRNALEIINIELEKLSIVASKTDNMVIILDHEGNFQWGNDAFARLYGQGMADAIPERKINLILFSTNTNIKEIFSTCVKEKKTISYESFVILKTGKKVWLQTTLTPILDEENQISKIVLIESDISKLKEAEEEIYQQNEEILSQRDELEKINRELEKLSIVASETDNAVMIMDEKGNLEWVNEGFTRLYGYTFDDLRQKNNNFITSSSRSDIKTIVAPCFKDKKTVIYESLSFTKDKREIWAQTTLTPILDKHEKIIKLIAIESDITKIKKAEEELEHKNSQITDSIKYAQRIQEALLPPISSFVQHFPESFIFYKPRDIVSGDFYWFAELDEILILAAVDCTGHGVPGAFMSLIGGTLLNEIVINKRITTPSKILEKLNTEIVYSLKQETSREESQDDGMDISICRIDPKNKELSISSANHIVYIINNGDIKTIEGDFFSIGGMFFKKTDFSFSDHQYKIEKDTLIYMFTDGFQDQFGGPENRKFLASRFKQLIIEIYHLPLQKQKEIIENKFNEWKGKNKQIDDVLVIGVKV